MSRHRFVQKLDVNDLLDEDYDDNGEEEMTAEEKRQLEDCLVIAKQQLGTENSDILDSDLRESLWYYYFDVDKAVNYLLGKKAKKTQKTQKIQNSQNSQQKESHGKSVSKENSNTETKTSKISLGVKNISLSGNKPVKEQVYKPKKKLLNIQEEYSKISSSKKPALNFVVIGHVDAGKSTLMGRLLYDVGEVDQRTMRKFQKESTDIGKGSFALAWVLDQTSEERERGVTIDIAQSSFETEKCLFTILDAPGHKDFVPNMIGGAAQADFAILVVDASTGAFESGFSAGGQTKEHALLVRSLGVKNIIIAVNKLDNTNWSEDRFKYIVDVLTMYLISVGFKKSDIKFIPCSGLTGENVVKRSKIAEFSWYKDGDTLVDALEKMKSTGKENIKFPLQMTINDVFKSGSSSSITVAGRIENGCVQSGEEVLIVPSFEKALVKNVILDEAHNNSNEKDKVRNWAVADENVLLELIIDLEQINNVRVGDIICPPKEPITCSNTIICHIITFETLKIPLLSGSTFDLHRGRAHRSARISRLISLIDKTNGEVIKKNPRHLTAGKGAMVEIIIDGYPFPVAPYKNNRQLGRIILRKEGTSVAAGVIDSIKESNVKKNDQY